MVKIDVIYTAFLIFEMKRVWVKEKSIYFISKLFLMEESTININKLISDFIQLLLVCVFFSSDHYSYLCFPLKKKKKGKYFWKQTKQNN